MADAQAAVRATRLNIAISKGLAGLKPPQNYTVTEWAEKKRRLSSESSAETGAYRVSRTPYLREVMDAFTDPKIRRLVLVSSSQIGKSEMENNIIGYIIDQDPSSILFILPTTVDAKEYSKLRIAPMIRDCPTLRRKVASPKSRDSGNTILQKTYPGGILTLCGSTEAHALSSKPIRYVIGDERDRWAVSAGKEGDPWMLAMARQITFYNAKAVEVSTPTIKGASAIADSFYEGTMERWCVQCPHCGEYHDIKFENIRFDIKETVVQKKTQYEVSNILYLCPGCACVSEEAVIKRQPAKWVAENPDAYKRGVRSFWLNSFVSPWASWESTILEYLYARGSTEKMQVVYNTRFGELWEDRGDLANEDALMSRREVEPYGLQEGGTPIELPDGVLVLTAGVDTQDDRMEYEVVGHGHFGQTWGIEKGIVMGRPDDSDTWKKLDEVLFDRQFCFADGITLRLSLSFVDQGGHFSGEVRQECRNRIGKKVFAIMGSTKHDAPYTDRPKKQKIMIKGRYIGSCWMYEIGVDSGKQRIMDALRVEEPGPRYCHFPKRDDYGAGYFVGLLSERLVYDKDKRQPWQWKKIPGHERNEALDCRNYAMAAFQTIPKDLDAIDRWLQASRGKAVTTAAASAPARRSRVKRSAGAKQYDEW